MDTMETDLLKMMGDLCRPMHTSAADHAAFLEKRLQELMKERDSLREKVLDLAETVKELQAQKEVLMELVRR